MKYLRVFILCLILPASANVFACGDGPSDLQLMLFPVLLFAYEISPIIYILTVGSYGNRHPWIVKHIAIVAISFLFFIPPLIVAFSLDALNSKSIENIYIYAAPAFVATAIIIMLVSPVYTIYSFYKYVKKSNAI